MAKLMSYNCNGDIETSVYRVPIFAGMEFAYEKGKTTKNKIREVGFYDVRLIVSLTQGTLSETTIQRKLF